MIMYIEAWPTSIIETCGKLIKTNPSERYLDLVESNFYA